MIMTLRSQLGALGFVMAAGGMMAPAAAQGQYEVLHAFRGLPGQAKAPLLEASDGQIYGVTTKGGRGGGGFIFAMRPGPAGLNFRIVHELERLEGGEPLGALIEADGELFGTASTRGAAGHGTIFKIDRNGTFVLLHTFQGSDGSKPGAALVRAADGTLYGTTRRGGAHDFGTVFRLATDGTVVTIHSLDGIAAALPITALVQGTDGHLYGSAEGDPSTGLGRSLFRITSDGTLTPIHTFSRFEGEVVALAAGLDGNLYGVGAPALVALGSRFYRITPAGVLTLLATTTREEGYSSFSTPMWRGTDGSFYGTLHRGGPFDTDQTGSITDSGYGSAYRLTPSGQLTILHAFTPAEGRAFSGIVQARDGLFYGVTFDGGISEHGVLFRMSATGALTQIRHFTSLDGESPWSPPVRGADGAFYGTTPKGGVFNRGTIYRMSADGTATTLHVFNGLDGSFPFAGLLAAPDGFLYGTALGGGCGGRGSIFRVAVTGAVSVIHCFLPGEGREPFAPLTQGHDGAFYGTTVNGGTEDRGTIFRVTAGGVLSTVHSFPHAQPPALFADDGCGNHPVGAVIEDADGTLIGTTTGLGAGAGCNFFLPPGSGTALLDCGGDGRFCGKMNGWVFGGLTRTVEGSLYGVTVPGRLYQLPGWNTWEAGGAAASPPIQAADGNLYGTTLTSSTGSGSIYRLSGNTLTTLKVLTEAEGASPVALVETADGSLHGVAAAGGPTGRGAVFRFRVQ
jgi:uncharacterized repeat protein (TIGR03803 family)